MPDSVRAPVLALTADASPERQAECAEAGLAACLTKPIAPEALLSAIDGALREAEAQCARSPDGGHARYSQSHFCPPRPDAVVTPEAFDALARLGGEDFFRDVIAQFVEEGAQIAERMACAVEQAIPRFPPRGPCVGEQRRQCRRGGAGAAMPVVAHGRARGLRALWRRLSR